jgi:hypothetical protein
MIYFNKELKLNLTCQNKKTTTIFIIISIFFILSTVLTIIFKNSFGNTLSLILEIIISSFYFSYLLIYIKILFTNKRYIEFLTKLENSDELIEGIIKENSNNITINQMLFNKIVLETINGIRQLYLLNDLKINLNINEKKRFIISGNYIKGEIPFEEINS